MSKPRTKIRSAVKLRNADDYLLLSLVAFAATVIITRAFLELTGYPQIGNDVLHIAHALWGGLLLFVAALLPLVLANRWGVQVCALLGGIGTGLFIDEVGKFITQANDYFYPPSLSIIYAFFLLVVFFYLYLRRPHMPDPRTAMYNVFDELKDALDGDLDTAEAARIESQLAIALQSDREEIVSLAHTIRDYLHKEKDHLPAAEPDIWKRIVNKLYTLGQRLGRGRHRVIISGVLIIWVVFVIGNIAILTLGTNIDSSYINIDSQVGQLRGPLILVQIIVSALMTAAVITWLQRKEARGLAFAIGGFLLSLVVLQLLYFYLSQFSAITITLIQLAILQILFAYRRWYL